MKKNVIIEPDAVDVCSGTPRLLGGPRHRPPPAARQRLQPLVEAGRLQRAQRRQARGHRQRVAGERARLVDGAQRRDHLHDARACRRRRRPAARRR